MYMPMLARRYVGRLALESFCERMFSVGNNVVTTANVRLASETVERMVIMRTNTDLGDALDGGIMDDFKDIEEALKNRDRTDASTTPDDERANPLATIAWSCTGAPKESAAE